MKQTYPMEAQPPGGGIRSDLHHGGAGLESLVKVGSPLTKFSAQHAMEKLVLVTIPTTVANSIYLPRNQRAGSLASTD